MNEQGKSKDNRLATAGAVVAFLVAIGLFVADKTASGGAAAAFSVSLLLLTKLHLLESLEVFGLKARLKQQISEVDHLLAKMRTLAKASAELSMFHFAKQGRWGPPDADEKWSLVRSYGRALREVGLSEKEMITIREPFLRYATFDLANLLRHCMFHRANEMIRLLKEEQKQLFNRGPVDKASPDYPIYEDLQRRIDALDPQKSELGFTKENFGLYRDDGLIVPKLMEFSPLPSEDLRLLEPIASKIRRLISESWSTGEMTIEAQQYLAMYGRQQDALLYREVFSKS